MSWTDPATIATGQVIDADDLDAYSANLRAATEWQDYTPAWTAASSNPSLGDGSIDGLYQHIGDLVRVRIRLDMGSTTTYGSGNWRLSLPVAAADSRFVLSADGYDGTNVYHGCAIIQGSSTTVGVLLGTGLLQWCNASTPSAWANTDFLEVQGAYRAEPS